MPIINAKDSDSTIFNDIPTGLYYYYIPKNEVKSATYLGFAPVIESLTYNPFIELDDVQVTEVNFDTARFGSPDNTTPKCLRLLSNNKIEKVLGSFDIYNNIDEDIETKMLMYPYKYYIVTDYINQALLIKPQLLNNNGRIEVKVITTPLTVEGKYNISVKGYKNDNNGNLEGIVNNTSFMLPVTSSIYSQFLATSSASFNQGITNTLLENDVTLRQGINTAKLNYEQQQTSNIMNSLGSILSMNISGLLNSGVNSIFTNKQYANLVSNLNENAGVKENAIISMANAKTSDMINTPNSLKTSGNDTLFNLEIGQKKIDIIEYEPTSTMKTRLQNYFKRFGYAINDYRPININTRKYFNFVKTSVCNVTGQRVPHRYLEEIKEIFNKGVTIWHVDNGAEVGNYKVKNMEV